MLSTLFAARGSGLALILLATACNGEATPDNAASEPAPEAAATIAPVPTATAPAAAPEPTATALPQERPALDITEADVEAQLSPALEACLNSGDAAKGVSVAMGACVRDELAVQDARLNAAYKSAMAKRGRAEQAKLRVEERAWIRRRDAECEEQRTGGTIDMVDVPMCLLHETVRRRITLQPMAG
ncbi:lysozyme inhibitor LprI family protein [Sphingomonas sp. PL-96]|uniref:lysozyme inhibitor LprI family protein n=1 Tax=Sphingomonas sp. PL-96 TaxID=2887201 RepID=UPI001E623A16|nr:lysozyme inhibitor LprI family protein [Sphingomonas sp. PL-96]MCC2977310.1 lysozyme inhibitor LprI family protein [Sphingomonas sp. PL-96]